ncbi:dienelactone hydrolase [Ligilactobacillus pobuzihii]|uniref:alpha/beta hydrolase family protein n=1 Tax=Ligilactobacillus pobuzihii TaxID=449659 RepID=UPI0019D05C5C|nr:dienelactone hydrolase [Ligilactobacillus pobuzihii]MBN7275696.1 dienelactone hydrolase [Ligilactobacillus pobuzihii]
MSQVTAQTLNFTDHTREDRPLKTTLWYPEELSLDHAANYSGEKHPLILMSHGSGSNRISLAWLAMPLAAQGYIVASPDHYGNTFSNPIPAQFKRYWERPRDLSFVLSELTRQYGPLIDQERIYAVGFSLGAYSVMALAGLNVDQNLIQKQEDETLPANVVAQMPEFGMLTKKVVEAKPAEVPTDLKDDRFKKVVALSPALGTGINSRQQTKKVDIPTLIIAPGGDQIAPIDQNGRIYHKFLPDAIYQELPANVGHFIFLPAKKQSAQVDSFWYSDAPGVDRNQIHQQTIETIKNFLLS